MRAVVIALAGLAAMAPGGDARVSCPTGDRTVAAGGGARIYVTGADAWGCWREGGQPWLLHGAEQEVGFPRVAGRFAVFSVPGAVRMRDLVTGAEASFDPADEVMAVLLSRYGRAAWIVRRGEEYEVHRGDLAQRDRLLDEGTSINPASLAVVRGRLSWRNRGKRKTSDFNGMRGDKPRIEDQNLRLVPGTSEVNGPGPITWRYGVEVERGLPIDAVEFAAAVDRILFDPRGWLGPGSRITLLRVDQPPFDFMVTLAKPRTVDRLCLPLHTASRVSCENRGRSVINWLRWSTSSPYWGDRTKYRRYLINHEVGHSLGHGHRFCGGRGQVAPVMQQQTGPAAPCIHAQWPKQVERRRSGAP